MQYDDIEAYDRNRDDVATADNEEAGCPVCEEPFGPDDDDFAQVLRGELCTACKREQAGQCPGCGEHHHHRPGARYCIVCEHDARDDYLTHRHRDGDYRRW